MKHNTVELDSNHVNRLLIKFSIPAILALMIQSLYNLVDTIYVGHGVGSLGIAALTLFFPVQMIIVSIANLIAIGGGALVSIALGKNDNEKANKISGNVILSVIVVGIVLSIICLLFIEPILGFFGTTEETYAYVKDYAEIVFIGMPISLLLQGLYALLRSEGRLKLIMRTTIASVTLNVFLNPLFLFVFDMGMKGVSIATLLSQFIVLTVIILYYVKDKTTIKIHYKYFIPDFKIIYKSCLLGTSSLLRMSGSSIINVMINHLAGKYGGAEGIASFGLAYRLIIFMFMPIMGLMQGSQPIIGFNYGAGKQHRIKKVLNSSIFLSIIISLVMLLMVILFGKQIIYIFSDNPQILEDTPKYLMGLTIALPLMAYQAIISGYLQAVGRVLASNVVTILRMFIFFTPIMLILSFLYDMEGLTASYFVSNVFSFLIILIWMRKEVRENLSEKSIKVDAKSKSFKLTSQLKDIFKTQPVLKNR